MNPVKHDAKCQDMSPKELKDAMTDAGVTLQSIANQTGVTRQHVFYVRNGRHTSHRILSAIADAIGIDLKRIRPSIYLYGSPRKAGRPSVQ